MKINITNPTISLRYSLYGEYYIIYDNQQQETYFAFASKIADKDLWAKFTEQYNSIQQVWLEYQETPKGKQITSLFY